MPPFLISHADRTFIAECAARFPVASVCKEPSALSRGVLGTGGMGRVSSAVSPAGRRVAVQVIREEYAADTPGSRRGSPAR